jgi:hypothetical protein
VLVPREYFDEQKIAYIKALDTAVEISLSVAGRRVDQRLAWATWIFARLCATGHSLRRLLEPVTSDYGITIDHASIGNLARNIIEASILISYVTQDGVSDEEWSCRKLAFHLHDCTARVCLFKGLGANDEYEKHKAMLEELRTRLSKDSYFNQLESDVQEKLRAGTVIYLHGLRSAAHVAGWNKDHFDAIYGYLSAQPHSTPMSFYRMDERGMDNKTIAPYQFAFVGFALENAHQSIRHATQRIPELFPGPDVDQVGESH